ncbi:hypothetical protein ACFWM1_17320 [Nocardia sp. NPDC058379]|uniref:hypothetical protein n=1 Tax=unclassified Nocardia TaxID=2637762 RepID=UPI00365F6467
MSFTDVFRDPPVDAIAQYPSVPTIFGICFAIVTTVIGIVYTIRTRSPLFFWAAVAGWTLYPLVVEPFGDWFVAVWYPANMDVAATVFDRPMPWLAVLFYGGGIPLVTVAAHEITKRGLPAKRLLQLVIAVTILEVPMEISGAQFGWMQYYDNHSVIFGVPIYCYVQNGGMFAVVAWVLAWLLPHIHGWRWVVVPFALAAVLPLFALVTTWPAYLAIHTGAGPVVGWIAGILATVLNAAVVVACIYSPALDRLREKAGAGDPPTTVQVA